MTVKAAVVLSVILVVLTMCGPAQAAFDKWAIAAKAGSLGFGGDLTTNLVPQVNLRAGAQWFGFDLSADIADIDYDLDVELLNPLVLVDWYPFKGSFRVSGGALFNQSSVDLRARSHASIAIGDTEYTAAQLGELRGNVDFKSVAPYVGIGWGNSLTRDKRWGFIMDMGVAFIGSPDITLSATGPISTDPTFIANLAEEERQINDDAKDFKFYPVFSTSLYFRF